MVDPHEVYSIDINMNIYNREEIVLRNKDGKALHVIKPKKGAALEVLRLITENWLKELNNGVKKLPEPSNY